MCDRETLRVPIHGVGDRVYVVGDCASYSKNYILDVHGAISALMKNLHNDLLAYEYRLQTITSIPISEGLRTKLSFRAS
ncbi:hypothetical protein CC78DRAFT_529125 [Lojkania enalia]|uniref:FAD/NAD(P)-binding domain-containing protein n=1 Tax=Lojkania enalia TaxID=147567 RepID=A0A9P4NA22_9PLEO|nr:hypothetical protein CC78DRAFT_529125 [Didymosphaeria enalia]